MLYPVAGRHPLAPAQHGIVAKAFDPSTPFIGDFALTGAIDRELISRALRHEIDLSGLNTVVLSSEEFSRYGQESINEFAAEFADFDVFPIAFIRRLTSIMEGYYATLMLYTSEFYEVDTNFFPLELVQSFRRWASIAADERIRIVDVDASQAGDSVRDMLTVLGFDPDQLSVLTRFPRMNQSPSPLLTAAIREFRRAGSPDSQVRELISRLQKVSVTERYTSIPPTIWDELEARYVEQHGQLRTARWVTGLEGVTPRGVESAPPYLGSMASVVLALGRLIDRDTG
jgi:hypothetical protein